MMSVKAFRKRLEEYPDKDVSKALLRGFKGALQEARAKATSRLAGVWSLGAGLMVGAFILGADVRALQRIARGSSCQHKNGFCRQCSGEVGARI